MKFLKIVKAIVWIGLLIVGFVGFSLYLINYTDFLNTSIKAYINGETNLDLSNELCEKFCDKNIVLIDESDIINYVSNNYYQLKLHEIKYEFPRTVYVYLNSRQKDSAIKANNGTFIVDNEFYVFSKVDNEKPNIEYDKDLALGQYISDDILKTGIKLSGGDYVIKIKDNMSTINMDDKIVIRLPEDLNSVKNVTEALNKIFKEVSLNATGLKEVDLRYSKPVLVY